MNRTIKFLLAGLLTMSLAVLATTVWAGTKNGTLGSKIHEKRGDCSRNKTVNMGDATFELFTQDTECYFHVVRINRSNSFWGKLPARLAFRSDGFQVTTDANGPTSLRVCFAYSPQDAKKNSAIYIHDRKSWVSLGGVIQSGSPALICSTTSLVNSDFALLGNH